MCIIDDDVCTIGGEEPSAFLLDLSRLSQIENRRFIHERGTLNLIRYTSILFIAHFILTVRVLKKKES